ncbi:hypothetical protein LguiA_007086 [Lonicera macranthoides]
MTQITIKERDIKTGDVILKIGTKTHYGLIYHITQRLDLVCTLKGREGEHNS